MLYILGLISRLADPSGLGCVFCWLRLAEWGGAWVFGGGVFGSFY